MVTIRKLEAEVQPPSRQLAERLAKHLAIPAEQRATFVQFARVGLDAAPPELPLPEEARVPKPPSVSPAQRSVSRERSNLPAQLTQLIGREHEIAQIYVLLRQPEVRLVTLTGPGGIGKTRLGLQVAAEVSDAFVDGVYFVDLAPISDEALVPAAIAETLGVKEVSGQALLASLKFFLHTKQLLLMLDNFEQIASAAPVVTELLKAAPRLTVLVTSRIRLHLSGEYEIGIPPLSVPVAQHPLTLDQLRQCAAVALFVERACAIAPSFQLTDLNAAAVAEICRRLDGLPLAIELAAARIKFFAPDALLVRLERRLPLLTGGPRDLPARQQTLRATIEWSEQLLNVHEQSLFAQLGVFVGGWTLEAAEAVCAPDGELGVAIIDGLQSLLDHSLLRQVEQPDRVPRFRRLETIREYALERLQVSGVETVLRQRHAEYYLPLAEALYSNPRGALQRVAVEHDNLCAALRWATEQPEPALALRLVDALGWFWIHAGYWSEAQIWLSWVLAQPIATSRTLVRAGALVVQGQVLDRQGNAVAAQTSLEEGVALFRELNGDKTSIMYALISLGVMLRERGDVARAGEVFQEMVAIAHETAEPSYVAWGQVSLAVVAVLHEDVAQARTLLAESLPQFRAEHNSAGIAWALNTLGHVEQLQGEYTRAAELHSECLRLFKEVQLEGMVWALEGLGQVALAQGGLAKASIHFVEGLRSARELGFTHGVAWCLAGLGSVAARDKQPKRAARLWGAAEALREAIGTRPASASRAVYEQLTATTQAQLGDEVFCAVWASGRELSLDEAIAEALAKT